MTIAKSINKTLDISVEDVRIDLTATIKSYDLTDTQFIFEIKSSNGMTINLTGSTAMFIVEYVHNSQTYAIQGDVNIIGTDTLSFNLPEDLKGYSGTVLIGIYVKLTDGTKIDIKDVAVRIEPSIMDKDIDFSAKTYFKDFESIKAEVILEGEKVKTQINQVLPSVQQTGETAKTQINAVVTDVRATGEKAKTDINAVLPSVQAEISEIKTEIENLPDIPDLFVAYADNLSGSGFSKTDSSKLYKGYGVKNSNLANDYRWERNVDNIQIGGRNYLTGTKKEYTSFNLGQFSSVINSINTSELNLKVGDYITLSCDLKVPSNAIKGGMIRAQFFNSDNDRLNYYGEICNIGEEKRIKLKVYIDSTLIQYRRLDFMINSTNTNITAVESGIQIRHEQIEISNIMTDYSPPPEDTMLDSHLINSILTTLSSENPSTKLGGTWVQLGTETKFSNTIYYWKRAQ